MSSAVDVDVVFVEKTSRELSEQARTSGTCSTAVFLPFLTSPAFQIWSELGCLEAGSRGTSTNAFKTNIALNESCNVHNTRHLIHVPSSLGIKNSCKSELQDNWPASQLEVAPGKREGEMAQQVLRLRRTDAQSGHVLLHVSHSGQKPLDLKLIGTEHAQLFHASLKESNVNNLQSSHFTGNLDEWKALLKYVLLHERPKDGTPEALQGLETVAAISGSKLTVTIRKNIGGITQRLGSIRLDEDTPREEVRGFEWADAAVANADALRAELETLQASVSTQQDDVAKLNQQLDDLVKAKKQHEEELLQKFAALLNAKKLKIRDQQRLLNGAQIDPQAAQALEDSSSSPRRRPGASRAGKRRANGASEEVENEDADEEEDGEEQAAQPEETPPPSDQETEDEGDFDRPAPAASASTQRESARAKQKEPSSMDVDEPEELPPRRELPFGRPTRQTNKQPEQPPPATNQEDDDEETDDEL